MPSVGFAVHFGSGVGPGPIGVMARSARARDKTARFHERDRRFESVSLQGRGMGSHAAWVLLLRPSLRRAGQRRDVLPHSVPPPGKEPTLTDGRHSRGIVNETGSGARFSQLIADGIVAEDSARASSGRRREWRRAESCARCGLRSKSRHGRSLKPLSRLPHSWRAPSGIWQDRAQTPRRARWLSG